MSKTECERKAKHPRVKKCEFFQTENIAKRLFLESRVFLPRPKAANRHIPFGCRQEDNIRLPRFRFDAFRFLRQDLCPNSLERKKSARRIFCQQLQTPSKNDFLRAVLYKQRIYLYKWYRLAYQLRDEALGAFRRQTDTIF